MYVEKSFYLINVRNGIEIEFQYPLVVFLSTVKPLLKQPLKIDKTKVLKTNGSLMKVESIAECSLAAFCNTFDLEHSAILLTWSILQYF